VDAAGAQMTVLEGWFVDMFDEMQVFLMVRLGLSQDQ
jgi:hypothetical protein